MVNPIKIDILGWRKRRQHQDPPPREVSDGTTTGLAAKVNELIGYLRRQHEAPGSSEGDVNLSTMYNEIERLSCKVAELEKLAKPVPEAPKDVGQENMRQEPVIKWAKVVEVYKADGSAGYVSWTSYLTDGEFAVLCLAHPCSFDGNWVDTDTDIYLRLPSAANTGVAANQDKLGVTVLLADSLIPYIVQPGFEATFNPGKENQSIKQCTGIVLHDYFSGAPYGIGLPPVLVTESGLTPYVEEGDRDWGAGLEVLLGNMTVNNGAITINRALFTFDSQGRLVGTDTTGERHYIIGAEVYIPDLGKTYTVTLAMGG